MDMTFNFDGDINKLKEEIKKLPLDKQEALKDIVDTLPIKLGLRKVIGAITTAMLKSFSIDDLMKVPTFALLTLLEPLQTTNADELILKVLMETGTIEELLKMADIVAKHEEEALKNYKDKQGSSIEEVLKNYVKNNQN